MKTKAEKKNNNQGNDYTAVLLEQMRDEIKGVAEGVMNLNEKMDRRFGEVEKRFDAVDGRLNGIDSRLNGVESRLGTLDGRFDKLEAEMKSSFKSVMEYLSRIEDEIVDIKKRLKRIEENSAADRKEIDQLKARLSRVEEALKRHKISLGRTAHGSA
jgi:chromosome segregation ATPase